ncbi:hypothetical protein LCGC14_0754220 [marine sediment metagenome]|uniref:ParB/Sulfiredoxin domain-containing protein n=1 Tax=marine sediment metagenome TaxID=412755 RepID=A0A0F9QMX5_9ZZZZ
MLEFHEIAAIFPLMQNGEFETFKADIEQKGLLDPIVLYEGKILDGRNRYNALDALGRLDDIRTEDFEGTWNEAIEQVMSKNLHRRHLQQSQRGMAAATHIELYRGPAKERQVEGGHAGGMIGGRGQHKPVADPSIGIRPKDLKPIPSQSRDDAGAAFGCSGATVERCRRVRDKGANELAAAVLKGEVSAGAADVLIQYPKKKQSELVKDGKKAIKAAVAAKKTTQVRKATRKKKPPQLIATINSSIDALMKRIEQSIKGTGVQRTRAMDDLRLCQKHVKEACEFLV